MDTTNLQLLVEHLEDNIDELEDNLEPLLSIALTATTKKLPLLDKAKLYVLIVYSIESLLFSYLRLNGVKAKDHPVFKELTRVKQYFEKIKVAEDGPMKPRENISLNKQAAARVIKHALAGNDKYDLERAEREAKEKLMAKRKLQALDQKKETQGNPPDEDPENESQESGEEVEDNDIPETIAGKIATEESIRQPSNGDQSKKKDKQSRTRRGSKAEKQAKKRKREQHDQTGQQPKKKKSGKSRSKQN